MFIYCINKCHKINSNCGRSHINFPGWIKNKKAAINPINKKENKRFQYAVTVSLSHEEIEKDPERITKIQAFINKYSWDGINFLSEK